MLCHSHPIKYAHIYSIPSVVPLSVLSNWEKQIEDHIRPGVLSHCVYYGTGRNMSEDDLQKYDVVITTYQTVTGEHAAVPTGGAGKKRKKGERALFDVNWKARYTVNCWFMDSLTLHLANHPR